MNIFNRKELFVTSSLEKRDEICEALKENHIAYETSSSNRDQTMLTEATAYGPMTANRVDLQNVYTVYVDKSHFALAQEVLRGYAEE